MNHVEINFLTYCSIDLDIFNSLYDNYLFNIFNRSKYYEGVLKLLFSLGICISYLDYSSGILPFLIHVFTISSGPNNSLFPHPFFLF